MISHDREFVGALCTETWLVEDGEVSQHTLMASTETHKGPNPPPHHPTEATWHMPPNYLSLVVLSPRLTPLIFFDF